MSWEQSSADAEARAGFHISATILRNLSLILPEPFRGGALYFPRIRTSEEGKDRDFSRTREAQSP
jgi:hypothetical protein